uniref:Gnk2-homologous domain-containing protein n=1 Tax=Vitis vinifera TaxID=29760 RepID=F6HJ10_VITVI
MVVACSGYMSLEYAMQGQFSNKSDLYSFGVLILEIISAKKNSSFYQSDHAEDLLSHTWRLWKNGTPMDPTIGDSYTRNEVIKCIHISLLCVQEVPYDRPSMAFIVLMLNSYSSIRIRSICNQVYWCCANWIQVFLASLESDRLFPCTKGLILHCKLEEEIVVMKVSFSRNLLFLCALGLAISCLAIQAAPDYIHHVCSNTTTIQPNSTYQTNLNSLLSSLSSNATRANGFYNATAGQSPDVAYGLFLCRGDVAIDDCRDCVANASAEILQQCSGVKKAIIWYDQCMLHYSNRSIFSRVEENPMLQLYNLQNVTDPGPFNQLVVDTMNATATLAANDESGKKFATKEENFTGSQTLYSLVQCTPDLSIADCSKCLEGAIGALSLCCSGKQGARTLTPSCNARYELYPFYQLEAGPLAPALAPAPTSATVLLPPPPAPSSKSSATGKL